MINYTGRRGGGPLDAIEMTKGLLHQGCKVIAVLSESIENREDWEQLPLLKLILIPTYHSKPEFALRSVWFRLIGRKRLARQLGQYRIDAIYCPMITFWTKMINDVVCAREVIVVEHDPIPHSGDKYVKWNKLLSLDSCYLSATKIVVHSKRYISYVEEKFNKHGKVFYIPLGRHDCYKYHTDQAIHRYDPQKINFVFFGTISKYKGIEVLLDAYKIVCEKMKNVSLSIYGSGDFAPYRKQTEQLSDVTVVNRWIADEEVAGIFHGDNLITVLPYLDATQSGVVLVSMDFGIPIIASNTGGLSEQIEDHVTGILVEPGNAQDLAEAMIRLANDEAEQKRIKKNVKGYLQTLDWDESARKLLEC